MSGDYDRAIKAYREALELLPDYPEAWNNLGNAYGRKGEYQRAIEAYRKALQLRPEYADVWFNLACAYSMKGRPRLPLRYLRRAIESDSKYKAMARTNADFDPIRQKRGFRRLVEDSA